MLKMPYRSSHCINRIMGKGRATDHVAVVADGAAVDGVVALVDGPPAGVAAEAGGVEGPPRLLGPHHVAADGLAALGTSLQKFLRHKSDKNL